jgi:hypothetical protein
MSVKENGFLVLHREPQYLTKLVFSAQAIRHMAKLEKDVEVLVRAEPEYSDGLGYYTTKLSIKAPKYIEVVREETGYRRRRERERV